MAQIIYPAAVIAEAARHGVDLSTEYYDPSEALETLSEELDETARMNGDVKSNVRWRGEDDFGFLGKAFRSLKKKVLPHKMAKAVGKNPAKELGKKTPWFSTPLTPFKVTQAIRQVATPSGVLSFGIPATAKAADAMAHADRLLGDNKVSNAALVVRNTKALAALGDASAKRGLAVLSAVANIRAKKKVPPGKSAVPPAAQPINVVQHTSPAQVQELARNAPPTLLQRIRKWIGL